jgi:general stress protein 26
VEVEKKDDRVLYFSTAIESPKVDELEDDPHVNVVMQDKKRFVSISGHARISRDRGLIERLRSDTWKVWFPKGKDDPSLALVVIQPTEATYWDMSGTQGIRYVFESAKAYLSGKRPPTDDETIRPSPDT